MKRYICIHGHFYQPPRENPWLEEVELQDSAHPFHDWNERITAECYAPNAASRILDHENRILDIINNYAHISFNFGPTLLSWMERNQPDAYASIIDADRQSRERFSGHGAALAQVYNHMIMPLATRRDKYTQVLWGIRDFESRFGRFPEGMWLPETAVDLESLDVLAELGIAFTILAPHQAKRIRPLEGKEWTSVEKASIDPTRAYLCKLPSGRSITLFFYDGPISQDIAFGGLLHNGQGFADRLTGALSGERDRPQMVHIATDGESYGHHHRLGDMALSYCLHHIQSEQDVRLTIYGEFLEKHPPTHEVKIFEDSSWSCAHGVERWQGDCGCNSGGHPGWTQAWRAPLRQSVNWLQEQLTAIFEEQGRELLHEPWQARNDYLEVIRDRSEDTVRGFLNHHTKRQLSPEDSVQVLKLLEMQRFAMLSFTSCGWFFDEISGIETTQVLQYAARAIQLGEELQDTPLQQPFMDILAEAPSNIEKYGNGRTVFEELVLPARLDLTRVGGHFAISSLFEDNLEDIGIYCYQAEPGMFERKKAGALNLAYGQVRVVSTITWEQTSLGFAAVHFGDHNVLSGIRKAMDTDAFQAMARDVEKAYTRGDVPEFVRILDKHFPTRMTLWHLFKDKQQQVLEEIMSSTLEDIEFSFRQILGHNHALLNFLFDLHRTIPTPLDVTAEFILNLDLSRQLEQVDPDMDELTRIVDEIKRWSVTVKTDDLRFLAADCLEDHLNRLADNPKDLGLLERADTLYRLITSLKIDIELWKIQNILLSLSREVYPDMLHRSNKGDRDAARWVKTFGRFAEHLSIKVD